MIMGIIDLAHPQIGSIPIGGAENAERRRI